MPKHPSRLWAGLIWGILIVLALCVVGGFASIYTPRIDVPQPWGSVRHLYFSTNQAGSVAHFRFKSNFPFDICNEVAVEVKTQHGWEIPRGPFAFKLIEGDVKAGEGQSFSVKVPSNHRDGWRVVLRSSRVTYSPAEDRRAKLSTWLESKGASSLAQKLQPQGPASYDTPGPEMKAARMGQLARPN